MDVHIQRRHSADEHAPLVLLDAVEFPPRSASVGPARRFIRRSLAPFKVPDDRMDDLVLAVSEAFTNAMEAHARRGVHAPLLVRAIAGAEVVAAEIEDHGGGRVDLAGWQPRPILVDRDHLGSDRGWGIQLMRELVDDVAFEATDDGTLVRLAVAR